MQSVTALGGVDVDAGVSAPTLSTFPSPPASPAGVVTIIAPGSADAAAAPAGPQPSSSDLGPVGDAPPAPFRDDAGADFVDDAGFPADTTPDPSEPDDAGPSPIDAGPTANCNDGLLNQDEIGVDCGGSQCAPCACSYSAPVVLGNPNYPGNQLWGPSLTADGLSLYFAVTVPGVSEQVAYSVRPDPDSPYGYGIALPPAVNASTEGTPFITPDGLSLYFFSLRGGGLGERDLYVATRANTADEFLSVTALTELNSAQTDHLPWVSADNLTMYFVSYRSGVADVYRAVRTAVGHAFGAPTAVTELNSASDDVGITLTHDGRVALIASRRPGGLGGADFYVARRVSTTDAFTSPEPIRELNTDAAEMDPRFSPDGTELYFTSTRNGGAVEIWRSQRNCP